MMAGSDELGPEGTPSPTADPELEADLRRLGLQEDLAAIVLKAEVTQLVSFAASVVVLPLSHLMAIMLGGRIDEEALGLALRHTLDRIRGSGSSILLGETLLSLARAGRMIEPLAQRMSWILEALKALIEVGAHHRLGRAYLDLATTLKDGGSYYDALHALDQAEAACGERDDQGGRAAARYHRAVIYRTIGQPLEALRELAAAEEALPAVPSAESWRNQIRSERVFNNLTLARDAQALSDLDAWIASGTAHYFPLLYRGEVLERAGNADGALRDYCAAAIALAGQIVSHRSDRFRRTFTVTNQRGLVHGLAVALAAGRSDLALGLLELLNTGGRAIHAGIVPSGLTPDDRSQRMTHEHAAALAADARAAVQDRRAEVMQECQERADRLLAEWELLSAGKRPEDGAAPTVEAISSAVRKDLPADAVLLEYAVVGDEAWIVAATAEDTRLHRTGLGRFGIRMLRASFDHECRGLFEPLSLLLLERELLHPVQALLPAKRRVIVSLPEEAYGLPVHAFKWREGVLVDTHEVQYVVGGITVRHSGHAAAPVPPPDRFCRFLGVPSVPYVDADELSGVQREREILASLLPAGGLEVALPARSEALLGMEGARVLHAACHGEFEDGAPLLSRLLFQDRPVFAFEIALHPLIAEMAVVTACETAAANSSTGGYAQGLAAAFHKAGVRSVIGSRWPLDDEASARFIGVFYESLLRDPGRSPVAALCAAQRLLRTQPEFAHPYFWAPFVAFAVVEA